MHVHVSHSLTFPLHFLLLSILHCVPFQIHCLAPRADKVIRIHHTNNNNYCHSVKWKKNERNELMCVRVWLFICEAMGFCDVFVVAWVLWRDVWMLFRLECCLWMCVWTLYGNVSEWHFLESERGAYMIAKIE